MIYIRRDKTKIPAEWIDKAKALTAELEKLTTDEERNAFIDKHKGLWGEIKDVLMEMSFGKCWYTEAPDAVSDWHVDHFRPKKRAIYYDETPRRGCQWLAFDWLNYRLCGRIPNSPHKDEEGNTRGKWDYFPLVPGSPRACWEDRCVDKERRVLLDPTEKQDPTFITFDETGLPIPSQPDSPIIRDRVEMTTKILYLDSARLKEARQRIWRQCLEQIEDLRLVLAQELVAYDMEREQRVTRLACRIAAMAEPNAPYSATARACIKANDVEFVYGIAEAEKEAA